MQLFLFGRTVENGRQSLGILSEITMNARKGRSLENLEGKGPSEGKSKRNAFFLAGETIQLHGIKFKILCIYARPKTFTRFYSFICRCVGWFM